MVSLLSNSTPKQKLYLLKQACNFFFLFLFFFSHCHSHESEALHSLLMQCCPDAHQAAGKAKLLGLFLSFFFCLEKVKRLCVLKSYSRLHAIRWNQIPFKQSWMFPWQKLNWTSLKRPVNKKGERDTRTYTREKETQQAQRRKREKQHCERDRKSLLWVGASKCLSPNLYHLQKFCLLECQRRPLQSASVLFILWFLVLLHITWHLLHKHELHICTV